MKQPLKSTRTTAALALAAGTTLVLGLAAAPTASANAADVIRTGSCTGTSSWKLKAGPDNGRIQVEGEVDSNRVGQTWRWRILHNGVVSARGTATTAGASGSFTVKRLLVDSAGSDSIGWRARNPATGEACRGGLTF